LKRLIGFFLARHMLVHVIVVVIVALGLMAAFRSPLETFPNVTLPTLFVTGVLPGASARDVETKVAIPIQEAVEELNGLKEYETTVSDGQARTIVELDDDWGEARVREAERDLRVLIDGINDFPPEMEDEPTIRRLNPQLFPVVRVALAGPSERLPEAGNLLERRLRRLDEVSSVALVGLQDPELRVFVDPVRARENGVTVLDVVDAIRRRNVSATGGTLESVSDRRQVVLWSRYEDPREVASTVIRFLPGGGALTVGDVARIELGREDTGLIAHTNGQPGITAIVVKQESADIVSTVDRVREVVEATTFPEGVTYAFVRDESFMARNRIDLMYSNGLIGVVLVAIVLFVFLTPMSAMWTLAGLPVVFLAALAMFPVFGFRINMVTLTGLVIVLGMVVDDAIVVSERIVSRRQKGEGRMEAALNGAYEMVRPVTASALTTMLAFVPLMALGGMNGKFISTMPAVVVLALLMSIAESFLILPAHLSMGMGTAGSGKRAFVVRMENRYRQMLRTSLRHRLLLTGSFGAVLLIVFLGIAPRMPILLYSQDDSEAAFVLITTPLGTPIEQTEAVAASIEAQMATLMGSDLVVVTARIGLKDPEAFDATRGSAENEALITAILPNLNKQRPSAEWLQVLRRELVVPEGVELSFEAEYMGPPAGAAAMIHVASNDDEQRRSTALAVADWVRSQEGLANVDVDERPGTPQIELALDYDRLALRGLDPDAVAQTVQVAFHGAIASEHRDLDETTEFRVLLDPAARADLGALLEIPIRNRSGELVQLRDVVTPIEVPAVARIHHRDGMRAATVKAGLAPGAPWTPLSFADHVEKELFPAYADIPGLELSLGGEAVETRKTTGDLGTVALMAFAGIGLVIALMLGSFLEAAFVVAIIPFAVAAVVLAFFFHGASLGLFAMLGTVGLAGVVVNAAIVMVDSVHRSVKGAQASPEERMEAIIEAVVTRLRPIIVTALTTLGGVMPMAYGIGGYDPIVAPMSLAIGWGLAISTLVTLFLVPCLYTLANDLREARIGEWLWARRPRFDREAGPAPTADA
jgi:multidrug efflux pump subunit AcrB